MNIVIITKQKLYTLLPNRVARTTFKRLTIEHAITKTRGVRYARSNVRIQSREAVANDKLHNPGTISAVHPFQIAPEASPHRH